MATTRAAGSTATQIPFADPELALLAGQREIYESRLRHPPEDASGRYASSLMLLNLLVWQVELAERWLEAEPDPGPAGEDRIEPIRAFIHAATERARDLTAGCQALGQTLSPTETQNAVAHADRDWVQLKQRLPTIDGLQRAGVHPRVLATLG